MCSIKIINKTANGILMFCPKSKTFNLSFSNLTFNFSHKELYDFISFIENIDCEYWETEYRNSIYSKKIPIPTLQSNFIILIDRNDLEELLTLLYFEKREQFLKHHQIGYNLIFN